MGYADGVLPLAVGRGWRGGFAAYFGSHAAPILGRVSMDLITLDVTEVPEEFPARRVGRADRTEVPAHALAAHAGTIDYEVLTNLGRRAFRRYIGG